MEKLEGLKNVACGFACFPVYVAGKAFENE